MSETLFKEVRYDLNSMVKYIEIGEIGLPDIQRPFVWKNVKIRDLFDSMYRGFPVGYLLFWQNALSEDSRQIGADHKQKVPRLLVVDGQQRLTSLYAVIKGIPVFRQNYKTESIEIAFNPLLEKFEVADAAIRRDKTYISNISVLWSDKTNLYKFVGNYLSSLRSSREIDNDEEERISDAITRLNNLMSFPFTALELSHAINEEQVAEVFVRINSKGTPLNQADFILTLMSVFWDEGRAQLEKFCSEARKPSAGTPSPYNHFIEPDPDQLLRVSVGLGFKRARLKYVYSILRGKDLETETFSEERRIQQFEVLKDAQTRVLNLQYWHDFMKAIIRAGYRNSRMISSQNTLIFTYLFYLLGRTEYKVDEFTLRGVIARWFFMANLTGRYTGSPESALEFDLIRFREIKDGHSFVKILERICDETLTGDYWSITLPNELATSSPRSPSLIAYWAALVLLDAKVLFSEQKVADLLDPNIHAYRSAIERHHLFPKGYLKTIGVIENRDINQIANFAFVEWGDNSLVGDDPPAKYVPEIYKRFNPNEINNMTYWHALPDGWESIDYKEFLIQRREMISKVIADGYQGLVEKDKSELEFEPLENLITNGETPHVEFKSTLRINLHTGNPDPRIELSCLKTIAGFLNAQGGLLIIGVSDDGSPVGIESDKFINEDKMLLHFGNLIRDHIGPQYMMYIHPRFEEFDGKKVLAIDCWKAKSPVYIKDGLSERFYIRTGAATTELTSSQTQSFIKQRF